MGGGHVLNAEPEARSPCPMPNAQCQMEIALGAYRCPISHPPSTSRNQTSNIKHLVYSFQLD